MWDEVNLDLYNSYKIIDRELMYDTEKQSIHVSETIGISNKCILYQHLIDNICV